MANQYRNEKRTYTYCTSGQSPPRVGNPRFTVGDNVFHTSKKLHGKVTQVFWSDAPGGSRECECYRYYIRTSRGLYSVTEWEIIIREVKTSTKSGVGNYDLTVVERSQGAAGKGAS